MTRSHFPSFFALPALSALTLPATAQTSLPWQIRVRQGQNIQDLASGGRRVAFSIPAGQTSAIFQNNSPQIRLQTGTVAGNIALTPSFITVDGGVNLTPSNPQTLVLSVAQSAPRLLSVVVGSKTNSSFTLQVTGYSTCRTLTQMDFAFTPAGGENVATTKLSIPVESAFFAWYQSSASQSYGSLFTATVTFSISGDVTTAASLIDTLQPVSATLTNKLEASAAVSVALK